MSFKNQTLSERPSFNFKLLIQICIVFVVMLVGVNFAFKGISTIIGAKTEAKICMLETGGKLYFENDTYYNDGSLCVFDRASGKITNLHTSCVVSLTKSGNTIYYGTLDCNIYSRDTQTLKSNQVTALYDDGWSSLEVFFADSNYLYYWRNEKSGTKIYRILLKDGASQILYGNGSGTFFDAEVIDNNIYFTFDKFGDVSEQSIGTGIFTVDMQGKNLKQLCSLASVQQINEYKSSIIFSVTENNDYGGGFFSIGKNGNDLKLLPLSLNSNFSLYGNTGYCYVLIGNQDASYSIDLNTDKTTQIENYHCIWICAVKDGVYCYYPGCLWFYDSSNNRIQDIINDPTQIKN